MYEAVRQRRDVGWVRHLSALATMRLRECGSIVRSLRPSLPTRIASLNIRRKGGEVQVAKVYFEPRLDMYGAPEQSTRLLAEASLAGGKGTTCSGGYSLSPFSRRIFHSLLPFRKALCRAPAR